ncbi:glycoside hydrolase family 61 protein-like protein [Microthyrium microscopicum]|uniref:lytic cellulose monooxygenase (C4-dehydrogenating) n=1 Tax=Microthyrium microscopicum TaxID=703497 RepID=A0A6A6TVF9_9PEZI|nr:glycoside hydrolase family 61 protein-like protein [Microthyrium microscopicum]
MLWHTNLLLLAATAQAHYKFSKLVINGVPEAKEWTAVRQTKSYQSNQGVDNVSSPDMRCFQRQPGTATARVATGEKLGFAASAEVNHIGPVSFYMAKVPEGANINTWEPAGKVFFKVGAIDAVGAPKLTSTAATWPAYTKKIVDFTVPKALPNGKYIVRVESIALHQASYKGGAQIYLACGQVEVTGGGNGKPSPLVAFPGAYNADDPGLSWSYYPVRTSYTAPGPPVWHG